MSVLTTTVIDESGQVAAEDAVANAEVLIFSTYENPDLELVLNLADGTLTTTLRPDPDADPITIETMSIRKVLNAFSANRP